MEIFKKYPALSYLRNNPSVSHNYEILRSCILELTKELIQQQKRLEELEGRLANTKPSGAGGYNDDKSG